MTNRVEWPAWIWLGAASIAGFIGLAAAYRDPDPLRIDAFSVIYTSAGLTDRLMITALLVLPLAIAVGSAALILLRRGDERPASIFAIGLVATYFFVSGAAVGLPAWIGNVMASTALVLMIVFLTTFPSATFRPRWAVGAPVMAAVLVTIRPGLATAVRVSLGSQPLSPGDRVLALVGLGTVFVMAAVAQVVRYRSMSSTTERYQSRWVLAALVLIVAPPLTILVLHTSGLAVDSPAVGYLVLASGLGSFALPAAVAVASFRYHLYEIDRIVSRTITYGLVALVVTGAYAVVVVGLPAVLGSDGPVYVAGATLVAAAVFDPARRRIQAVIDRRFNRTRYDAERELVALTTELASVTEVSEVQSEVIGLLRRTIEPTAFSWWVPEEGSPGT